MEISWDLLIDGTGRGLKPAGVGKFPLDSLEQHFLLRVLSHPLALSA